MGKPYSTDLSDGEWECLILHVPAPNMGGRPRTHSTREILSAIFYVFKTGAPGPPASFLRGRGTYLAFLSLGMARDVPKTTTKAYHILELDAGVIMMG
jgi:hypothetical protein